MIGVDASVLISHLDPENALHDRAVAVILECPPFSLAASVITMAEVFAGPARTGDLEATQAALRPLEIEVVPVDATAGPALAALRARTSLKLPDCCVLHAAQTARADHVLTFDARLAAAARDLGLET